jgi:hypothetical protein
VFSTGGSGVPCWMAQRDVVPGTLYAEGIVCATNESQNLVLTLSRHAIASAHVGKELERAASKQHPSIGLRTDSAPLTPAFEYFVSESQWIDSGVDCIDIAIAKLVRAVQSHLRPGASAAPEHSPERRASRSAVATPGRRWLVAAAVVPLALGTAYL